MTVYLGQLRIIDFLIQLC